MTIDKITRLFGSGQTARAYSADTQSKKTDGFEGASSEAVAVSDGFGAQESGGLDRSKRLADIKAAVNSGTYKPDINAVAEAFARELL